ncbi:MAG: hypothetical protein COB50_05000 [Thiotrichales bacterium]|nr:MAG: hypothetical protein COB50_05000 [Thiotrichales bacterium]
MEINKEMNTPLLNDFKETNNSNNLQSTTIDIQATEDNIDLIQIEIKEDEEAEDIKIPLLKTLHENNEVTKVIELDTGHLVSCSGVKIKTLDLTGKCLTTLRLHWSTRMERSAPPVWEQSTDLLQLRTGHLAVCRDSSIEIWSMEGRKRLYNLSIFKPVGFVEHSTGHLISGGYHGIYIHDMKFYRKLKSFNTSTFASVSFIGISKDIVAYGTWGGIIKILSIKINKKIKTSLIRKKKSTVFDIKCKNLKTFNQGASDCVFSLAKLKEGCLASGGKQNIYIWDIEREKLLKTLTGHSGWIKSLVVLDTEHLVSGSDDTTIRIWDIKKSTCLKVLRDHNDYVRSLLVLKTGRHSGQLVSASFDGTIKIWDIKALRKAAENVESKVDVNKETKDFNKQNISTVFFQKKFNNESKREINSNRTINPAVQEIADLLNEIYPKKDAKKDDEIKQCRIAILKKIKPLKYTLSLSKEELNLLKLIKTQLQQKLSQSDSEDELTF